jgi:hypothetical protein
LHNLVSMASIPSGLCMLVAFATLTISQGGFLQRREFLLGAQNQDHVIDAVVDSALGMKDLHAAREARAAAKSIVARATGLRETEAAAYAKESGDVKTHIAAIKSATDAISKGTGGEYLQTPAASALKKLATTMDISSVDRDMLASFFAQSEGGVAPASASIVGILKQMTDTMEADLASATAEEQASIEEFDGLMAAKTKEINTLTKEIQTKTARLRELGEPVFEQQVLNDTSKVVDANSSKNMKQLVTGTLKKLATATGEDAIKTGDHVIAAANQLVSSNPNSTRGVNGTQKSAKAQPVVIEAMANGTKNASESSQANATQVKTWTWIEPQKDETKQVVEAKSGQSNHETKAAVQSVEHVDTVAIAAKSTQATGGENHQGQGHSTGDVASKAKQEFVADKSAASHQEEKRGGTHGAIVDDEDDDQPAHVTSGEETDLDIDDEPAETLGTEYEDNFDDEDIQTVYLSEAAGTNDASSDNAGYAQFDNQAKSTSLAPVTPDSDADDLHYDDVDDEDDDHSAHFMSGVESYLEMDDEPSEALGSEFEDGLDEEEDLYNLEHDSPYDDDYADDAEEDVEDEYYEEDDGL